MLLRINQSVHSCFLKSAAFFAAVEVYEWAIEDKNGQASQAACISSNLKYNDGQSYSEALQSLLYNEEGTKLDDRNQFQNASEEQEASTLLEEYDFVGVISHIEYLDL